MSTLDTEGNNMVVIDYVLKNLHWIFSGVGAVLIIWILDRVFKNKGSNSSQQINSGKNSTNIQVKDGNSSFTQHND